MDVEFLKELETQISNVGTQECWQREIAGRIIWFSPIPVISQAKVNDTLANSELGANVFLETKRLTVAHSIVGIDTTDLRPWRFAGTVFPSVDPRTKGVVNVDLPNFIYNKMPTWGWEFIERAFDVFVDLMESHKRESLKNVQFENAKDPVTELAELEARAGELRMQLGMPLLTEIQDPGEEAADGASASEQPMAVAETHAQEPAPRGPPVMAFDPFAAVPPPPAPAPVEAVPPSPPPPHPPPAVTVPVPVPSVVPHVRARQVQKAHGHNQIYGREGSSPENPFQATPSVPMEVVEAPAERVRVAPPQVDNISANTNPRFRPTGR